MIKKKDEIKLTTSNELSKSYYQLLDIMNEIGNYLYNNINYIKRQNYLNHQPSVNEKVDKSIKLSKPYLNFKSSELYSLMKKQNNYNVLPNSVAQNICILNDQDYSSFFGSLKSKQSGTIQNKLTLPRYKNQENNIPLTFSKGNIRIKDNIATLTTPKEFNYIDKEGKDKTFTNKLGKIKINLPKHIIDNNYQINIIELSKVNNIWYSNITYTIPLKSIKFKEDYTINTASIDLGLVNLATLVDTNGDSVIFDGKQLKSRNRLYNKKIGKYQTLIDNLNNLNKKKETSKLQKFKNDLMIKKYKSLKLIETNNRNNYIKDFLHKTSKKIIQYCKDNNIENLIIGKNKQW